MKNIAEAIRWLREHKIEGRCIDLLPLSYDHLYKVVELRNQDKNRYYLNQSYDVTLEGQTKWYQEYLTRSNDIYWCIFTKSEDFIGTIRLYDISESGDYCDQGSFMIDERYADEGPYALEAELLSLDIAFDFIKVTKVVNEDRADNRIMNNLTKKLGFVFVRDTIIREVSYKFYELTPDQYQIKRSKIDTLIEYWKNR